MGKPRPAPSLASFIPVLSINRHRIKQKGNIQACRDEEQAESGRHITKALVVQFTMARAKPPHARSFPASFPRMWCSTSESPQGWRSSARRSLVGGRLSTPNFSGSPTALVLILAKRQYSACEE